MKILVLYSRSERLGRSTVDEHLYSFKRYAVGCYFHYVNVIDRIPSFLSGIQYDTVILHYTFLAEKRFLPEAASWNMKIKGLEKIGGYKIAFPQDEYDQTERLCKLFKEAGIDIIYTCFTKEADILKAYPYEKTGVTKIEKVFTGYIEEEKIKLLAGKSIAFEGRSIDIGYRGRKLPAYFGKHGQLKYELVQVFKDALKGTDLVTDIKNTNDNFVVEDKQAIKLGFSWYDFLLSCKAFIGCEGGSSLMDPDGAIQQRIKKYLVDHSQASFSEIEARCFPGMDYNIHCFALSPRHFEAAMTKTLQILVEGEYGGIFKPWVHYVPLKRDFGNIEEVLAFMKDVSGCKSIIETAYQDIVLSRKHTYRAFVQRIIGDIPISGERKHRGSPLFHLYAFVIKQRNAVALYGSLVIRKLKHLLQSEKDKIICN